VREALSSLIASVGLRVTAYGSAAEFLEAEKPGAPACLVLDLQLPGPSGLELQRELADGSGPPMVFITGHGDIPSSARLGLPRTSLIARMQKLGLSKYPAAQNERPPAQHGLDRWTRDSAEDRPVSAAGAGYGNSDRAYTHVR
jgi:CheY-like chemotaxis protein